MRAIDAFSRANTSEVGCSTKTVQPSGSMEACADSTSAPPVPLVATTRSSAPLPASAALTCARPERSVLRSTSPMSGSAIR